MTQGFPEMCGFCFLLYISSLEMGFGGQLEGVFTQCQAWREVLASGRGKHSESCVYEPSVKFSSREEFPPLCQHRSALLPDCDAVTISGARSSSPGALNGTTAMMNQKGRDGEEGKLTAWTTGKSGSCQLVSSLCLLTTSIC